MLAVLVLPAPAVLYIRPRLPGIRFQMPVYVNWFVTSLAMLLLPLCCPYVVISQTRIFFLPSISC